MGDPGERIDLAGGEKAGSELAGWGGLDDGPGAAGEGDGVHPAEFGGDVPPGSPGAAFGDPDEDDGVLALRVEERRVRGIYYLRNPEKLSWLDEETAFSR